MISGALIYLGMSANSDASAAKQKEQAAVNKINALQTNKPYPSKENEKLLLESLATFAADTKKFQDTLLKFRPEDMPKLSANQFSDEVSKYVNKLDTQFKAKKIAYTAKEKPYFGMEAYAGSMAPENATQYLNYNRLGLEWLFTTLADSGITSLNNVHRPLVAEALSKPKEEANPRGKKGKGRNKNQKPTGSTSVYDGLPIEITFTGTEASMQKFITDVAAGEDYFFAIKLIKIRNEEQEPVTISKATFAPAAEAAPAPELEAAGEGDDPAEADAGGEDLGLGGGFDIGGEEEFEAEEDPKIIKQVIGDEQITVFMQLELVLLKDAASVPIPRLKKEAPVKKSPKKAPKTTPTK